MYMVHVAGAQTFSTFLHHEYFGIRLIFKLGTIYYILRGGDRVKSHQILRGREGGRSRRISRI